MNINFIRHRRMLSHLGRITVLCFPLKAFWGKFSEDAVLACFRRSTTATLIINHDVIMNIDEIIVRHSTLTNGTAGLLISLITCSETAVPIRIGSISLYFPDCMFGEDRNRLTGGYETTPVVRKGPISSKRVSSTRPPFEKI